MPLGSLQGTRTPVSRIELSGLHDAWLLESRQTPPPTTHKELLQPMKGNVVDIYKAFDGTKPGALHR